MGINFTAATAVANTTLAAAFWNAQVRDSINGIQAAWTTYTPALTAVTTNPTLGTGSSVAGTYLQIGKGIKGTAEIVFGTAGVAAGSGLYGISIPVAATAAGVSAGRIIGYGVFFDSSTSNFYHVMVTLSASSTVARMLIDVGGSVSNTVPVVPGVSDQIRIHFDYEAA